MTKGRRTEREDKRREEYKEKQRGGRERTGEDGGGIPVDLLVWQRFRDLQASAVCVCVCVCVYRVIELHFIQYLPTKLEQSCELHLLGTKCLSSSLSLLLSFLLSPPRLPSLPWQPHLISRSKPRVNLSYTHTHTQMHIYTQAGGGGGGGGGGFGPSVLMMA